MLPFSMEDAPTYGRLVKFEVMSVMTSLRLLLVLVCWLSASPFGTGAFIILAGQVVLLIVGARLAQEEIKHLVMKDDELSYENFAGWFHYLEPYSRQWIGLHAADVMWNWAWLGSDSPVWLVPLLYIALNSLCINNLYEVYLANSAVVVLAALLAAFSGAWTWKIFVLVLGLAVYASVLTPSLNRMRSALVQLRQAHKEIEDEQKAEEEVATMTFEEDPPVMTFDEDPPVMKFDPDPPVVSTSEPPPEEGAVTPGRSGSGSGMSLAQEVLRRKLGEALANGLDDGEQPLSRSSSGVSSSDIPVDIPTRRPRGSLPPSLGGFHTGSGGSNDLFRSVFKKSGTDSCSESSHSPRGSPLIVSAEPPSSPSEPPSRPTLSHQGSSFSLSLSQEDAHTPTSLGTPNPLKKKAGSRRGSVVQLGASSCASTPKAKRRFSVASTVSALGSNLASKLPENVQPKFNRKVQNLELEMVDSEFQLVALYHHASPQLADSTFWTDVTVRAALLGLDRFSTTMLILNVSSFVANFLPYVANRALSSSNRVATDITRQILVLPLLSLMITLASDANGFVFLVVLIHCLRTPLTENRVLGVAASVLAEFVCSIAGIFVRSLLFGDTCVGISSLSLVMEVGSCPVPLYVFFGGFAIVAAQTFLTTTDQLNWSLKTELETAGDEGISRVGSSTTDDRDHRDQLEGRSQDKSPQQQQRTRRPADIICRICEQPISSEVFQLHSTVCYHRSRQTTRREKTEQGKDHSSPDKKRQRKGNKKNGPKISDFRILKLMSRGGVGEVYLGRKRRTGDVFAIKVMKKKQVLASKKQLAYVRSELDILSRAHSPFVVKLFYAFECKRNLYIVMENVNSGDMCHMLQEVGCLEEGRAKVYLAEVLLGLQHLHDLNIKYRDLKPENILLAFDGHLKLADFGFAVVEQILEFGNQHLPRTRSSGRNSRLRGSTHSPLSSPRAGSPRTSDTSRGKRHSGEEERRNSMVGTPDYMAPEVIKGEPHGKTVDFWALGVLLYEFLVGFPPFNDETPLAIFENILKGIEVVEWPEIPEEMSYEAQDIIIRLLELDPTKRLGANGCEEVKAHPFFHGVDWDNLLEIELMGEDMSPTIPKTPLGGEIKLFSDSEYESMNDTHKSVPSPLGSPYHGGQALDFSQHNLDHLAEVNDALGQVLCHPVPFKLPPNIAHTPVDKVQSPIHRQTGGGTAPSFLDLNSSDPHTSLGQSPTTSPVKPIEPFSAAAAASSPPSASATGVGAPTLGRVDEEVPRLSSDESYASSAVDGGDEGHSPTKSPRRKSIPQLHIPCVRRRGCAPTSPSDTATTGQHAGSVSPLNVTVQGATPEPTRKDVGDSSPVEVPLPKQAALLRRRSETMLTRSMSPSSPRSLASSSASIHSRRSSSGASPHFRKRLFGRRMSDSMASHESPLQRDDDLSFSGSLLPQAVLENSAVVESDVSDASDDDVDTDSSSLPSSGEESDSECQTAYGDDEHTERTEDHSLSELGFGGHHSSDEEDYPEMVRVPSLSPETVQGALHVLRLRHSPSPGRPSPSDDMLFPRTLFNSQLFCGDAASNSAQFGVSEPQVERRAGASGGVEEGGRGKEA